MGLKSILKKITNQTDESLDKTSDQIDVVARTLYKTSSLIADEAVHFAKNTYHHLKDAGSEISEKTKVYSSELKDKAKEDFSEVKQIATDQMNETKQFVTENVHKIENALKDEPVTEQTNDNEDSALK